MKSGERDHLADKENMPPPSFNRGLRRLAISPGVNGSNASISRTPKVRATEHLLCFVVAYIFEGLPSSHTSTAIPQEDIGTVDPSYRRHDKAGAYCAYYSS